MTATIMRIDRPIVQLAVFAAIYALSQAPALAGAWWYLDDYPKIAGEVDHLRRACQNGRPLEALWMATLSLDAGSAHASMNVALRLVQALAHVLVAWLGGRWLARAVGSAGASWLAALFLLWPFHTEAVLWRTAGSYPLGALLGVAAVRLAWPGDHSAGVRRLSLAGVLVVASALTNQATSLIVWTLPLVAVIGGARRIWNPRTVGALLAAHTAAALISVLVTRMPGFATGRASFTTDPLAKIDQLHDLVRHTLAWRELYPVMLTACHLLLLVCAVGLALRHCRADRTRALRAFGLAIMLCVAPFASLLVVREIWSPFRVMYLGPWILVAAGCVTLRWSTAGGRADRFLRWSALVAVIGSLSFYLPIGWRNAEDYAGLFSSEQRIIDRAIELAGETQASGVFVEPPPANRVWNPFGPRYPHGDSTISALIIGYATRGRIEAFSPLTLVGGPELRAAAARESCERGPSPGFRVVRDAGSGVVMILQPRPPAN